MKKAQLIVAGVLLTLSVMAQKEPVHFDYRAEKIDASTYAIHIRANIEEGWHIYSKDQPKQAISQPTKIVFAKSPIFTWKGPLAENGKKEKYEDKIADIVQYQYGGMVEFVQTLTLKFTTKATVTGSITYQACTEEMCDKPKTVPFSIAIE
jgi:thiol:disulfide interchange protein DsbD